MEMQYKKLITYCALFPTFSSSMIPVTTLPEARLISLNKERVDDCDFDVHL